MGVKTQSDIVILVPSLAASSFPGSYYVASFSLVKRDPGNLIVKKLCWEVL